MKITHLYLFRTFFIFLSDVLCFSLLKLCTSSIICILSNLMIFLSSCKAYFISFFNFYCQNIEIKKMYLYWYDICDLARFTYWLLLFFLDNFRFFPFTIMLPVTGNSFISCLWILMPAISYNFLTVFLLSSIYCLMEAVIVAFLILLWF